MSGAYDDEFDRNYDREFDRGYEAAKWDAPFDERESKPWRDGWNQYKNED